MGKWGGSWTQPSGHRSQDPEISASTQVSNSVCLGQGKEAGKEKWYRDVKASFWASMVLGQSPDEEWLGEHRHNLDLARMRGEPWRMAQCRLELGVRPRLMHLC